MIGPDDVETWLATLRSGECLSERSMRKLCQAASELLMEENNVQPVLSPVTGTAVKSQGLSWWSNPNAR